VSGADHTRRSGIAGMAVRIVLVASVCSLVSAVHAGGTTTPALTLVLPVVIAGLVGGRSGALVTAVAAGTALNLVFIPPRWTLKIRSVDDIVAFGVFVAVALVIGTLVAWETDRRRNAERRTAEVEELHLRYQEVVAERERLREESQQLALLSHADEQRRAMLRSVSHDLRTPLAAIRAATSDMRSDATYDDETRRELLDVVGEEAERLDRLVDNLLSMAKIEAGVLRPDRQAVPIDELVGHRVRRLTHLFSHVTVTDEVPAGLPLVDADYSQIDQVVTNLLENAARHSPPGTTIEIGASAGPDAVEVWVADRGPGVDLGQRDELFEPFRRGPGSDSSGIGLAICRAIIDAHGGSIDVRNRPDGGAVFEFTLPVRNG
jgi:two-component system, OmpR family, sensor histidine kinase KdpD